MSGLPLITVGQFFHYLYALPWWARLMAAAMVAAVVGLILWETRKWKY